MMLVAGCEPIEEVSRFVLDWAMDAPMHKVVLRGEVPEVPSWLRESLGWAASSTPKWDTLAEPSLERAVIDGNGVRAHA